MNLQRSLLVCSEDHFEDVLAMDVRPTFSRHGIAQILSALALLIWLNEKVGILCEVVIVCLLFEHHSVRWHCPCSVSVCRVVVAIRYEMPDVSRLWNVALPFE